MHIESQGVRMAARKSPLPPLGGDLAPPPAEKPPVTENGEGPFRKLAFGVASVLGMLLVGISGWALLELVRLGQVVARIEPEVVRLSSSVEKLPSEAALNKMIDESHKSLAAQIEKSFSTELDRRLPRTTPAQP